MRIEEYPGYVSGFAPEQALRELGGWPTKDGRVIKHGMFFRGAALDDLDMGEQSLFQDLGIKRILDLRSAGEVAGHDDWVPRGAQYERISGMFDRGVEIDFSPAGFSSLSGILSNVKPDDLMPTLYASMAIGSPALHEISRILVQDDTPVYFHCTAGKDRTGVTAALIMMLLGADKETIMDEFMLTNAYRASIINMDPSEIPDWVSEELRERWAELNGVNERGLNAFWAEIDKYHDSWEDYFDKEFNIDAHTLRDLRDRYTTEA